MDTNKKFSVAAMDARMEQKGGFKKVLWQIVKFFVVSCLVGVIQIALVNILYFALKTWTEPLPDFLRGIFTKETVGEGNDNWGYVLPFFVSNLVANIYGFIQNKRTTFKADAPMISYVIYLFILVLLILFTTWLQGVVANALESTGSTFFAAVAPTLAAMSAGTVQLICLFPLEKYVLLKEKKSS